MVEKPTSDRNAAADVVISLGFASVLGDLQTIPRPNSKKDEEFHSVCPDCATPTQFMGAALVCKDDKKHGPFTKGEIKMGKKVGDKIVVVDTNKIKEARTSVLPKNEMNLQVHKRADVEQNTFPMGNAYVFIPKGSNPFYAVLVDVLKKRRDVCFIAKTNMRKSDKLVKIDLELNDQLVVRELVWPEDMKHFAPIPAPQVTDKERKKLQDQAATLVDVSIEDFDPAEYSKESKARIAQVVTEAAAGGGVTPKAAAKKVAKDNVASLEDQLQAAIDAARAKKAS